MCMGLIKVMQKLQDKNPAWQKARAQLAAERAARPSVVPKDGMVLFKGSSDSAASSVGASEQGRFVMRAMQRGPGLSNAGRSLLNP